MIISIFASIWAQNLWDELILKNEIKLLENEYWKDTKFIVFSYDYKNPFLKKSNVEYKEYFPIWSKQASNTIRNFINFFSFLACVIKSDLIVIGGGWIIYDNEKQATKWPIDSWLFRTNIFSFFHKKYIFYAVWINVKNRIYFHKLKKLFINADKVTVRDNYSYNLLKEIGIKSEIVKDPVFSDVKNYNKKSFLIKRVNSFKFSIKNLDDIDLDWKKVALAFRKWYLNNTWGRLDDQLEEGKINELITYLLKKNAEVILLPHSFHKTDILANDYSFLSKFLRINEKIRIINSMEEVYKKYIYKEFDISIAMRLHSIILSQIYWIPFVWISYSTKTDEILDQIEKGE
jgi:polysaccharide pyruvyl transferase WcaK-like protein